jgi:hypothetical protein
LTATAASTTAAAVATAAATATVAAAATTTTTATRTAFTSFIASDFATGNGRVVQTFDGSLSFLGVRHFDEAKTTGAVCFPVHNDVDFADSAELRKSLSQLFLGCLERQISNVNISHSKNPPTSRSNSTNQAETGRTKPNQKSPQIMLAPERPNRFRAHSIQRWRTEKRENLKKNTR